jgi:hypothetical protein
LFVSSPIVGVVSSRPAAPVILDSLRRLEYRGYDSAGIAALVDGKIERRRAEGKLSNLASVFSWSPLPGTTGSAHTRWATHGAPTETNAHPAVDAQTDEDIARSVDGDPDGAPILSPAETVAAIARSVRKRLGISQAEFSARYQYLGMLPRVAKGGEIQQSDAGRGDHRGAFYSCADPHAAGLGS